jgi:cysteine-rich repeat protein
MHRQGLLRSVFASSCLALACGDGGVTATSEGSSSGAGDESSSTNPATTNVDDSSSDSSVTATSTESSEGSADSSSSTGAPDLCGNGELDEGEECDDSNVANGDACKADCTNAFEIAWTVTHNGEASGSDFVNDLWIDGAGNIYAAGGSRVAGEGTNIWLQQYLPDGSEGWTVSYDAAATDDDSAYQLLATDDGDFVLAGGIDSDTGYVDIVLVRVDGATQMVQWQVNVDGPGMSSDSNDYDTVNALAPAADGGFLAVGAVGTDTQGDDVWVARYDAMGNEVWTASYDDPTSIDNTGSALLVRPNGDIIVFAHDYENFMSTGRVVVYDSDGVEQPAQGFTDDLAFNAAQWDADGNMVVTGYAAPSNTLLDVVTRKYDPDFTQIWEAVFDGALDFDFPYGLHVDDAGNVYVVGIMNRVNEQGNAFIAVYDADGIPLWGDEFNDELDIDESWSGVGTDAMGDVVIGGYAPVFGQQSDTFVRKYHPL